MYPCALFVEYGFWWIFPIIMIAMMIFCSFMMRRHGISGRTGCCATGTHHLSDENERSPE